MSKVLELGDRTALIRHYDISVAEGHLREGTLGLPPPAAQVPSNFLAEEQITELADPARNANAQLSRAIAHLVMKLSRMYVESVLVGFSINASLVGDHYEVLPKVASIEASSLTSIPRRLSPHAHVRGSMSV